MKPERIQENDNDDEYTPEILVAPFEIENKEFKGVEKKNQKQQEQQPWKRRSKQKDILSKKEQEIACVKEKAAKKAVTKPNLQEVQLYSKDLLCSILRLKQVDIRPDGQCLFAAVLDQLKYRNKSTPEDYDVHKF